MIRRMPQTGFPRTGTQRILDRAFALLDEARPERGRLADLPCGTGYLSVLAAEKGWEVTPLDLHTELWEGGNTARPVTADLNQPLDLPDDSFDAIVCCEGIEHIENPWLVLREFSRILCPEGVLVISIPNTIDLRQRVRMLRRGFLGHYMPAVPDHINLMGTFGLCHALLRQGFCIEAIDVAKCYGGPFQKAIARCLPIPRSSQLDDGVRRMLSRPDVLCGRTVVFQTRLSR